MPGTRVVVAIPDQDLRRSVEFVVIAHGFEPVAKALASDKIPFSIVDEAALGDRLGPPFSTELIIVLSSRNRPLDTPLSWWWLQKPHLGEALEIAIEEASRRTP